MVARYRPGVTIMVMVADEQVSRHLALVWGVYTFKIKYCSSFDEIISESSVDLIMTSHPFSLLRKKEYGNEDSENYLEWFKKLSFRQL